MSSSTAFAVFAVAIWGILSVLSARAQARKEEVEKQTEAKLRLYEANIKAAQAEASRANKDLPGIPHAVESLIDSRNALQVLPFVAPALPSPPAPAPTLQVVASAPAVAPVVPAPAVQAPTEVFNQDFAVSAADEQIIICMGYGSNLQIGRHADLDLVVATLQHDGWNREISRTIVTAGSLIPEHFVTQAEERARDILSDLATGAAKRRPRLKKVA